MDVCGGCAFEPFYVWLSLLPLLLITASTLFPVLFLFFFVFFALLHFFLHRVRFLVQRVPVLVASVSSPLRMYAMRVVEEKKNAWLTRGAKSKKEDNKNRERDKDPQGVFPRFHCESQQCISFSRCGVTLT
jgi:hypothetical protein